MVFPPDGAAQPAKAARAAAEIVLPPEHRWGVQPRILRDVASLYPASLNSQTSSPVSACSGDQRSSDRRTRRFHLIGSSPCAGMGQKGVPFHARDASHATLAVPAYHVCGSMFCAQVQFQRWWESAIHLAGRRSELAQIDDNAVMPHRRIRRMARCGLQPELYFLGMEDSQRR